MTEEAYETDEGKTGPEPEAEAAAEPEPTGGPEAETETETGARPDDVALASASVGDLRLLET